MLLCVLCSFVLSLTTRLVTVFVIDCSPDDLAFQLVSVCYAHLWFWRVSRTMAQRQRANFTNEEYADILYTYGVARGNALAAQREYQQRYPNRRLPDVGVFSRVYRRARETGRFQRRQGDAGRPRIYRADDEEEILRHFQREPNISTRQVANLLGISQYKVWKVVHESGRHPYHYTPVQVLEGRDPVARVQFCRYLLNCDIEDPNYLKQILWTDESKFDKDGITNYHNTHFWEEKAVGNPKKKRPKGSQRRFSLNVWMGIINNNLIGPFFLPDNLNGEYYEHFLRNVLPELLEDIPLATLRAIRFQHDGCPAHYRRQIRDWLDENYTNNWIGRGGPIPWPARSPDLTPMDYYVWGHMKTLVYVDNQPVLDIDELRRRIILGADQIRANLSTAVVKSELRKRMRICVRNGGSHFENEI